MKNSKSVVSFERWKITQSKFQKKAEKSNSTNIKKFNATKGTHR